MTYIVVAILVWVIAAFPVAVAVGRAIHLADLREPGRPVRDSDTAIGRTANRT